MRERDFWPLSDSIEIYFLKSYFQKLRAFMKSEITASP